MHIPNVSFEGYIYRYCSVIKKKCKTHFTNRFTHAEMLSRLIRPQGTIRRLSDLNRVKVMFSTVQYSIVCNFLAYPTVIFDINHTLVFDRESAK
jgi:hypothetical protein